MKFFTYGLALAGFIGLSGCAAIEKRDVVTDEIDLVTNLYNQVLTIDANINATVAGYNSVTILLNPEVVSTVRSDIEQLTSIINAAAAEAPTLSKRGFTLELDSRQISNTTLDLADILATLLEEVVNTINPLLDNLGLGVLVNDLIVPLENALVALVRGVGAVVDGLVAALLPILDALTSLIGGILGPILALLGL